MDFPFHKVKTTIYILKILPVIASNILIVFSLELELDISIVNSTIIISSIWKFELFQFQKCLIVLRPIHIIYLIEGTELWTYTWWHFWSIIHWAKIVFTNFIKSNSICLNCFFTLGNSHGKYNFNAKWYFCQRKKRFISSAVLFFVFCFMSVM